MGGFREERRGGMDREIGIGVCVLPYVKQTAGGKRLCSSGSSTGCSVVSWRGGMVGRGRSKRERTPVYISLICFVEQQKLAQQCKGIIPQ